MQLDRIINAWDEALAANGQNGGFLFGGFSIADCMYAPVVSRFTTYDVAVPDRVKAYMEKIWTLPGMQNWLTASRKEIVDGIA
jgi:glutathione S-transferase